MTDAGAPNIAAKVSPYPAPAADARPYGRRRFDGVKALATASTLISTGFAALILLTLLVQSGPAVLNAGETILTTRWNPQSGHYGIIPMVFGSLIVMAIAMIIALPIGLLAAIYIAETRSLRLKRAVKSALEILAGIPSIVYGLIAVSSLSLWVADAFDLQSGRVILTAGLILSVMILPTFLSLTEDAISSVPRRYRENAYALGLYRHEMLTSALLPIAAPGIAGAALLALGRALGETMAVMLVIGSIDRLPSPLFNVLTSGQTITSKLGREIGESAFGSTHFSALVLMSFLLVSVTLLLTLSARLLFTRAPK